MRSRLRILHHAAGVRTSRLARYKACWLAAVLWLLLVQAGCKEHTSSAIGRPNVSTDPVPVKVQRAQVRPTTRSIDVFGTLHGEEDIALSSKVAARVETIYKDVGDRAVPGEVLLQLEKVDFEIAARQKELAIREALAKLNLSELPAPDFNPALVPVVQRARLQYENAQARFLRGKQLHDQKPPLLSDQDYADLETAASVAKAGYDVELLNARAILAEALSRKSDLDAVNQRLLDTTIRVPPSRGSMLRAAMPATRPADDVYAIAERLIAVGEYVKEGTPLFRLVDDDPVKLRAHVPERYVADMRVGQTVRISVEAYPDEFRGTISRINPQIDPASRNFLIEAIIPNPDHRLKPGAFAKGWVDARVDPRAVFVPKQAIVSFAGVTRVYVAVNGKATEAQVETGDPAGEWVEIRRGLTGNEMVITTGLNRLVSGSPIVVQ